MAFLIVSLLAIGSCNYGFLTLAGSLHPMTALEGLDRPGLGVIDVQGEIFDTRWAIEALKRFGGDDQIRAVILRINSPGGAVAPCQELYGVLAGFGKPVVVSMGSVAASGGLYLAVAGNPVIMANPGTITGSIGVIMETIQLGEAMEKLGVATETIKSGPYKDMGSLFRPMRDDERELLQRMVTSVWEQFVRDVAAGRPKLTEDQVRAMADGRIFNGEDALRLGLIDELGGWSEAVGKAAELGGIDDPDPPMIYEDGTEGWLNQLLGSRLGFLEPAGRALESGPTLKFLYRPGLF
jgi:protease-4